MDEPLNEYYARTLRLKPLIEQDVDLLQRIKLAFETVYDNAQSLYGPVYVSEPLQFLGAGQIHAVIGLGKSIIDPINKQEIPLAISLCRRGLGYDFEARSEMLQQRIDAFDYMFAQEGNVPYFLTVVTANASIHRKTPRRIAGIVTEDITNGKRNTLEECFGSSYCIRIFPDGTRERIYLDPEWDDLAHDGKMWLEERARIDLK